MINRRNKGELMYYEFFKLSDGLLPFQQLGLTQAALQMKAVIPCPRQGRLQVISRGGIHDPLARHER